MIVDYRERDFIALCPDVLTKNLPVADIWIGCSGETVLPGAVLIERKTVADFEASILDGRQKEQRTRLLAQAQETKSNVMYMIEGDLSRTRALSPTALQQFLNRLQLRQKIAVLRTQSIEDTVGQCQLLLEQFNKDKTCFIQDLSGNSQTDTIHVKKKENQAEPKYFFLAAVQQCPGISGTIATKLQEKYRSLISLSKSSVKDLADVQIGSKKLGPKVAARLLGCLTQEAV